jgi:hypothetical protein
MQTLRSFLLAWLMLCLACSSPAFAQERHVVEPGVFARVVAQHLAEQDADRAAIRDALRRPEVQEVAQQLGIDPARMSAFIETLAGADLQRSATAARHVNEALSGGASTVTFSTTTIIIVLLLIILIIVAVR